LSQYRSNSSVAELKPHPGVLNCEICSNPQLSRGSSQRLDIDRVSCPPAARHGSPRSPAAQCHLLRFGLFTITKRSEAAADQIQVDCERR
jgi:hypothetical protein